MLKLLGCCLSSNGVSLPAYMNGYDYMQFISPESALHYNNVYKSDTGTFDFTKSDIVFNYCISNYKKFNVHTLTWSLPDTIDRTSYVTSIVNKYKTNAYSYVVVNELVNWDGTFKRPKQEIKDLFILVSQLDPGAKLIFSDYKIEEINSRSDAIYNLIAEMKTEGIKVDILAMQCHYFIRGNQHYVPNWYSFQKNIDRFANIGVEIAFSEVDVSTTGLYPNDELDQIDIWNKLINLCKKNDCVTIFQLWGLHDEYSWIPAYKPGYKNSCVISNGVYKKIFHDLQTIKYM